MKGDATQDSSKAQLNQHTELKTGSVPKTHSELILEYIKVLKWPVFVIIILLLFWTPLKEFIFKLPMLVDNTEEIEVAKVKITLRKNLFGKLSPSLKSTLSNLEDGDVEDILLTQAFELGNSITFNEFDTLDFEIKKFERWRTLNLVTRMTKQQLEKTKLQYIGNEKAIAGYIYTPSFYAVKKFLVTFTTSLIKEAQSEMSKDKKKNE